MNKSLWLVLALVPACVGYEPGIEVPLTVRPGPSGPLSSVTLGDGTAMDVAGAVRIEHAELVACGSSGGHHHASLDLRSVLSAVGLAPAVAHAQHAHHSPLMIAGVFDVAFAEPAPVALGVFGTAPGCYDRVRLTLTSLAMDAHADDHTVSIEASASIDAVAALEPPLMILVADRAGPPSIEVTLAPDAPFALLRGMPGEADGVRVLAGIAAQASATIR